MEFNLNAASFIKTANFKPVEKNIIYDILIIGGGPAGLSAAVYCMRKGVLTGIIFKDFGGQVTATSGIENYPGFRYIEGTELAGKFKEQVMQFGIAFSEGVSVESIEYGNIKKVFMEDGTQYLAKALIIAAGKKPRRLNVPGETEFTGRGVAYCSTCDAPFFSNKKVVVAGGGNSAVESAMELARVAEHVTIIQFLGELTADKILTDKLSRLTNVTYYYEYEVIEIKGDDSVKSILLKERKTGNITELASDGIFIEIGLSPNTEFIKDIVQLNGTGEILIDCACRTDREGIFAAGDVTNVPYKQIIVAAGEGAKAALSACDYILKSEE